MERRIAQLIALPVRLYRALLSPWLPASCRFHPSCSAYVIESLEVHGPVKGLLLAVRRILRCHPFHDGGFDPVPPSPSRVHLLQERR